MDKKQYILLLLAFSEAGLLLLSNFLANVIWGFDLQRFYFVQDGGVLTFPLIYILTDLIVELYGKTTANQIAGLSALFNLAALVFCLIASHLPIIPDTGSEIAQQTLGFSARIFTASVLAFYVSQVINNICFVWIAARTKHEAFWQRSLGSSLIGRLIDTLIFNLVAFAGRSPFAVLAAQIVWAIIVPSILEAALNPITKMAAQRLSPLIENADLS